MKHLFIAALALVMLLPGCADAQPESAVSRAPYFEEAYTPETVCSVTVDGVFFFEEEDQVYLVLDCTAREVLRPKRASAEFSDGADVLVWVDITEVSDRKEALAELLGAAETLVVNGRRREPSLPKGTEVQDSFLALWGKEEPVYSEEDLLVLPPCVFPKLDDWGVLPFVDGALDGGALEEAIGDHDGFEMAFSIDEARPEEKLYFQNGDTLDAVCRGLSKYVGLTG